MRSSNVASYRDLIVWKRSMDLVDIVYRSSATWPASETYGLSSQARRAAVSIPANIAEGLGRNGRREYAHHLGIAYGSLCEVETLMIVALRQNYVSEDALQRLLGCSAEVGKLTNGLLRSLNQPRHASEP